MIRCPPRKNYHVPETFRAETSCSGPESPDGDFRYVLIVHQAPVSCAYLCPSSSHLLLYFSFVFGGLQLGETTDCTRECGIAGPEKKVAAEYRKTSDLGITMERARNGPLDWLARWILTQEKAVKLESRCQELVSNRKTYRAYRISDGPNELMVLFRPCGISDPTDPHLLARPLVTSTVGQPKGKPIGIFNIETGNLRTLERRGALKVAEMAHVLKCLTHEAIDFTPCQVVKVHALALGE